MELKERICQFISQQQGYISPFELPDPYFDENEYGGESRDVDMQHLDPMFEDASRLIVREQSESTSLLQRKFAIGYNRTGRLMDQLEKAGIVGAAHGSKPREVLIMDDMSLENLLSQWEKYVYYYRILKNNIMKKALLSITIVAVCFSCNNRGTTKASESDQTIEDSVKQLSLIRQQDSINRERIFEELGDTVFGKVCFGMNKTQYRKAFNEFKKPLKNDEDYYDFVLAGYEFHGREGSDIEKDDSKSVDGYPYGLDDIMKEESYYTYFYQDRLFSVVWNSWRNIQEESIVKNSLGKLINLFEKKYGKPNVNNIDIFNHSYIETGAWYQMKVVARWETKKRKIIVFYRDLVGGERDKWVAENYPSYYQYELYVLFLDKNIKKEVDEYIKPILQKFVDDYKEKKRQDSIKNAKAL